MIAEERKTTQTQRERRNAVLKETAKKMKDDGWTNHAIAKRLFIAESTVHRFLKDD